MNTLVSFGRFVFAIFLLSFGSLCFAVAQIEENLQCVPEGGSYAAIQPGGLYIPSRDTFHVLVVFVQFPDDAFDINNPKWPKGQPPEYLNTFNDSVASQNSQNGNMSHYFREMSMGTFKLTGKGVHVIAPQTRRWYYDNYGHQNIYGLINRDVLLRVDSMMSFAPFDKWTRTGDYSHVKSPNGIVDMVWMLYRNVGLDSAIYAGLVFPGTAWLGGGPDVYVDGGLRRINMYWPGSGTTSVMNAANDGGTLNRPNYRVQIHELAHFFFGGNSWHNGSGFWAMLGGVTRFNAQRQSCANSLERELVGWIAPDSIYQNTTNVTLTDFATTGRAVKIKVLGSNPNEYFRIEYHLRASQFDTPEELVPNAKGLYILHQTGLGSPEDGYLRILPADGRWKWVSDTVVHPSYYPTGLAVLIWSNVDRMNGYDDSRLIPWTWIGPGPTPNVPYPSRVHFYRDRWTNQVIERELFRGDGGDAFSLTKNNVFTPWSNPNTQNQAIQKTWVSIEIINEIALSGTIVLNIYFDSTSAASLPPSKPPLGWDPRDLGRPYEYGWIYLAWGADFWDGQPIEADVNWSELQRKIGTGPWVTLYSGPNRVWSDGSITYDPNGSTPVYFRVRVRDAQNKWSVWSDLFSTKMTKIAWQQKIAPGGEIREETPSVFALSQNFPNPFNPTTTIRYALPVDVHVVLRLYNTLGQEVATLVQGEQKAGWQEASFDASGLSSGIYLYRLQADRYVETKKMLLVK